MTAPKKVALFSTNFLEYSQTFVYDEIRYHQQYQAEVFCHNRMNEGLFPYERVHALNTKSTAGGKLAHFLYGLTTYNAAYLKKIRQGRFDILHAHFGPGCIYALTYKKAAGAPLIATYHGYDVPILLTKRRFYPQHWRYWMRSKAMLRQVDRFLAASDELRDLLIELGAPREKVKVWRLGVELDNIKPNPNRSGKDILMAGRFVEKKGFEYGIKAVASLLRQGIDCRLHIVGSGRRRAYYDRIIRSAQMSDRVFFLGTLSHTELLRTMEKMDIVLAPSVVARNGDRESGLLVAKEAAARYLPVVGTRHGGIPEIIEHERTGFLAPEREAESLARYLALLLASRELREKMGHEARRKMEREYNIEQRVMALETHYDAVIEDFKRIRS